MIPGLAEMLLVANLAVGAPAAPSLVADVPVSVTKIDAKAVQRLTVPQGNNCACGNPSNCGCQCGKK
jgi:hypothetical protein